MDLLKIRKEISPDSSILKEIDEFIKVLNSKIKDAVCIPGGSVAKGTFLKGDFDVDIFVRFKKEKDIDKLESYIKEFRPERIHGSRDYFQFNYKNLNYELVPVIEINDPKDAKNVTDMSPMHVEWVRRKLKKGMADEIRLLKKFCKSCGCYGAESYIQGFSGHVIDILVIHYGSFLDVLKAAQKWKPKVVIDTEKHYKNNIEIMFHLNQSKIEGPMIIIDPILMSRNASSSLSFEKFTLFRKAAAKFLKAPNEKFFEETDITEAYLKKKLKGVIILKFKNGSGKTDVIGSKILKAFEHMKTELKKAGFEIKKNGWHWNRKFSGVYWFTFKNEKLDLTRIVSGPPLEMKEACKAFKEKYIKTFEQKGKLCSEMKNEIIHVREYIKYISKQEYFKEKVELKEII